MLTASDALVGSSSLTLPDTYHDNGILLEALIEHLQLIGSRTHGDWGGGLGGLIITGRGRGYLMRGCSIMSGGGGREYLSNA